MKTPPIRFAALSTATAFAAFAGASPAQDAITRVSVSSSGGESDFDVNPEAPPRITDDGRYVVFDTFADDLVANDTNLAGDVFVHDRVTGATVRVSVDSAGGQADGLSEWASLSADGGYVAFYSIATDLVPNDTNGKADVFVHDRDPDGNGIFDEGNGTTTRVSLGLNGAEGDGDSFSPSISADGTRLCFHSSASNLVAGDSNGTFDVFLLDRSAGTTIRVSVDSAGNQGNGASLYSTISADGRVVAFPSWSTNLVAGDGNAANDAFLFDVATGVTTRVSVDSAGNEADGSSFALFALSSDGAVVAFTSEADNLVAGDTNGAADIFVHDTRTGTTERVSVDSNGGQGDGASYWPALSADGALAAFATYADGFAAGDTNGEEDVFVRDRVAGTTRLVSVDCAGVIGDAGSFSPGLTPDGRFLAFTSEASNLVDGDHNDFSDTFVCDLSLPEVDASWTNYGSGYAGTLGIPALTASADPAFGTSLTIDVGNSLGSATAGVLLIGTARASIPTSAGGTILVDFALLQPIALGAGGLSIPATIPRDRTLCGVTLDLQALEADPGAAKKISFTPGLELVIGH